MVQNLSCPQAGFSLLSTAERGGTPVLLSALVILAAPRRPCEIDQSRQCFHVVYDNRAIFVLTPNHTIPFKFEGKIQMIQKLSRSEGIAQTTTQTTMKPKTLSPPVEGGDIIYLCLGSDALLNHFV